MTSVVLVDSGGTVVEYVTAVEDPHQQEGECDADLEQEGQVEDEGEVEDAYEEAEHGREDENFPAIIVEEVPGAGLAEAVSYDDEANAIQEVGNEQDVESEKGAVEASVQSANVHCSDKTIEAAEALLHMDSPSSVREDCSPEAFVPPYVATPDFLHAAMRPDIAETEVEISTEDCCGDDDDDEDEDEDIGTLLEEPEPERSHEPVKKRRAGRKLKPNQSSYSADIGIRKKTREGKGSTIYLWEFLLDLLQDKNTCPRYIKWTQREKGIFKLVDSKAVSKLWGKHKNKPDMNYETMGRALRYYYQRGILAKVEGQRLVYQFKEMPKNIVIIDEDKADMSTADDPMETAASYERIPQPSDVLLKASDLSPRKPNILRGGNRGSLVQSSAAVCTKTAPVSASRTASGDGRNQQAAVVSSASGPRTVRVAMQVPVVMTSLGQKISTVALQQPAVRSGAAGHAALLSSTAAGGTNSQQKVVIQTIPTMVPATAENGEKITVQLAKIITIPAHQLAQCQLQTPADAKSGVGGSTPGIGLLGSPLTVQTLTPVSMASGAQVMRLSVPTQAQAQTLVVSGSASSGAVTVSTANRAAASQPRIIGGVFNGSELVVGGDKAKAAGVQVQAVQMAVAVQQNLAPPQRDPDARSKLETPVTIKTEDPEC
uniref:ETS-related transcription factor Elf-2b isoform X3 n=1 Tax=Doryrhamphus excisus TaxID=161450 RepID=UPI0025AE8AE9|nr:ETS-related transcription factor Elf-2b isoform X3 [Doryrhamphus excisus]